MAGSFADARRGTLVIVALQLAVTALAALAAGVLAGWQAGYSALLGGAINAVASLYMAMTLFAGGWARRRQGGSCVFWWVKP